MISYFLRTADKTSGDYLKGSCNNKWEELKELIQTMKAQEQYKQASDTN